MEKAAVLADIGWGADGFPFRENYGLVICLLAAKARRDKQAMAELKENLLASDE